MQNHRNNALTDAQCKAWFNLQLGTELKVMENNIQDWLNTSPSTLFHVGSNESRRVGLLPAQGRITEATSYNIKTGYALQYYR